MKPALLLIAFFVLNDFGWMMYGAYDQCRYDTAQLGNDHRFTLTHGCEIWWGGWGPITKQRATRL